MKTIDILIGEKLFDKDLKKPVKKANTTVSAFNHINKLYLYYTLLAECTNNAYGCSVEIYPQNITSQTARNRVRGVLHQMNFSMIRRNKKYYIYNNILETSKEINNETIEFYKTGGRFYLKD